MFTCLSVSGLLDCSWSGMPFSLVSCLSGGHHDEEGFKRGVPRFTSLCSKILNHDWSYITESIDVLKMYPMSPMIEVFRGWVISTISPS